MAGMTDLSAWWPLPEADGLRAELEAAYADPSRGYHDTLHLREVLERLDELGPAGEAVVLAAWFHDAVYDGRPDAEERSARWAERALPDAGADPATVAEVARLVRLTEQHRPAADDEGGALLSDADLGILAAGADRYRDYVATVRREYAHVPDDQFAAGRGAILGDLLAKPTLFHTAYAREHWEAAARANVARELAQLESVTRGQ
jgi:predicted metal-dependent HD superfamily phosphohydrolase